MPRRRCRPGFTLVELSLVLCVVLMLFAIAIPNFIEARLRAEVSRGRSELALLAATLESYRADTGAYPPNAVVRQPSAADLACLTTPVAYMTRLPRLAEVQGKGRVEVFAHYLNLGAFHPREKPYSPEMIGGVALYSLSYPGPDGKHELQAAADPVTYKLYDPTNGTMSVGDLVFFGP